MEIGRERCEKALQEFEKHGRMLTVEDGWLVCPFCKLNRRVMKIDPETVAARLPVYCRSCKREFRVDIQKGQSFKSQSR